MLATGQLLNGNHKVTIGTLRSSSLFPLDEHEFQKFTLSFSASTYPTTNYEPQQRPRAAANFAIYPSTTNDTFIYEQSSCSKSDIFSTSELDSASTSAFSPTMSTDTLPSTIMGDQTPDDLRSHRPPTPAARPIYSLPHEPQALSRTPSTGHHIIHEVQPELGEDRRARVSSFQQQLHLRPATPMHGPISPVPLMAEPMSRVPSSGGGRYVHIPEYAASTLSEFEVDERDRIAKINAEYNSHTSSSSSGSSPNDADRRWTPTISAPIPPRDNFTRVASSQPLHFHPNQVPQEAEFNVPPPIFHHSSSSPINIPASFSHNPYPRRDDGSPPLVERISSQVPSEYGIPQTSSTGHGRHPLPSIPSEAWSRDATFDSEQTMRGAAGHYRTSPKNANATPTALPQELNGGSAHATYATSSADMADYRSERRQDRPLQPEPVDIPHQQHRRRSSMVGPRPDSVLSRPHSEVREYFSASPSRENNSSAYGGRERERERDREGERERERGRRERSYSESPSRVPQAQGSPLSNRASFAADIRRDTRTPVPSREADEHRSTRPSRGDSYVPEPPRSSKDTRAKSQSSPEQPREMYIPGPLTASPTQMRMSPTDLNSSPLRVSLSVHEDERAGERIRTRSISFSQSARPTTPALSAVHYPPLSQQQPQTVYNGGLDPRQQAPDRRQRPGDTSPSFASDPLHADQRKEARGSSAQATYYPQPQPPSVPQYEPTSQRQHMPMPPPAAQPPSRSIDRAASTLQSTAPPHTRGLSTQERPRSSFVEPVYTQSHTEPLRHHSDGDEPYTSSMPSIPRSVTTPHDKLGSNSTKVMLTTPPKAVNSAHSNGSAHSEPQPQRRYSDGDQARAPTRHANAQALSGRSSVPLLRSVRWTENLICPSPVLARQRRKGWFNRRGYVARFLSFTVFSFFFCFFLTPLLHIATNYGPTTESTSLLPLVRSTLLILTIIQSPVTDG